MPTGFARQPPSHGRLSLFLTCLTVYAAGWATLFWQTLAGNAGHFTYGLDDAYIHLALSQSIWHGFYGMNPGEPSSPASSLLWPFLLAPFAHFSWQVYVPLVINTLAAIVACALIAIVVQKLSVPRIAALAIAALLVFTGNLVALTFTGMEHTLQIALAACTAIAVLLAFQDEPIPTWMLAATALSPLVRYENLILLGVLAFAMALRQDLKRASIMVLAAVLPLVAFSLYLLHLGLPALPLSVLAKSQMRPHGLAALKYTVLHTMVDQNCQLLGIVAIALLVLAWRSKDRKQKWILAACGTVALLHLTFGPTGWLNRYEVYMVLFGTLVFLVASAPRLNAVVLVMATALSCGLYAAQTWFEHDAAHSIYCQPYQMHLFETRYDDGNLGVNDLGLASYYRQPGVYIFDYAGLGSPETARQKNRSPEWMEQMAIEHHLRVVMLFPKWFTGIPSQWMRVAEFCANGPHTIVAYPCESIFAVRPEDAPRLRQQLRTFSASLPEGATMHFH